MRRLARRCMDPGLSLEDAPRLLPVELLPTDRVRDRVPTTDFFQRLKEKQPMSFHPV